ncbi:MAG: 3'(2'),5'-bisphosphate nucleotidase CysQ [Deltaproteobacteria bacterium]|nr:3'(2'),5'-bisphosphate nucleotidase CysQ [Deltaproteobacteria bacterium]MCW5801727.1 3'(2'),5'-bisphosphate nucleotidase CysQ [Deltaproteobacteria bacterium]
MSEDQPTEELRIPLGQKYILEIARAIDLARQAGAEVVRLRRGELGVEMKAGDEPVTVADRRASELIVAGLRQTFPNDPVVSEELAPEAAAFAQRRLWLVDPIDGTKDFIRGGDGFSVMIGLVVDGRPALGVVHQPTIDRTYFATPDGGAHMLHAGTARDLAVSAVATAGEARLVASASHRTDDIDRVKERLGIEDEQNIGSVGVKLCLIAQGQRDLYVNPSAKTKAWDTCAPEAILAAAGGRLSDLFGDAIDYRGDMRHKRGLVASNGHIHGEVVTKLGSLFAHLREAQ